MNLRTRLAKHLSVANVLACLALFVALGGGAYAATTGKISGNKLKNHSVGAGKLKNGTITNTQIKPGSLTGSSLDLSALGTVPAAETASRAGTANTANSATNAGHATTARSASTADTATHANSADSATTAATAARATEADHATSAGNADTVGGKSATDLTVSCKGETELFGGMCWDKTERPLKSWIVASSECAKAGGRLPDLSELVAYLVQPGEQATGADWSADTAGVNGSTVEALTAGDNDEAVAPASESGSAVLGFHCLFYRTN